MNVNGTNAVTKKETVKPQGTLRSWLNERKNDFFNSIPKGTVEVDRFIQSAFLAITNPKNPDLAKCDKESISRALKEAASYGLELNGTLGQAYLIPYNESVKNKATGNYEKVMTCHFQMGYKGLIALARRSNTIKTIAAECIYENDEFSCELASGRSIHHKMNIFQERGDVIGYYCLVELTNGGEQFAVMSKKDAERFRDTYSKSYIMARDKSQQNWGKNFDAMALKTCVIKALKLCPISIEALEAVSKEEMKDSIDDVIDISNEYTEQIEKNKTVIANTQETKNIQSVEVENVSNSEQTEQQAEITDNNVEEEETQTTSELASQAMGGIDDAGINAAFDKQMEFDQPAIF